MIARYEEQLRRFGLTSIDAVKRYQPTHVIENWTGHRDTSRLDGVESDGRALVLYLKRVWSTPLKNGLASLLKRGRVWSVCRQEWENCLALNSTGIETAEPVAYGEECGALRERFSFIITRAARGDQTLEGFLRDCHEPAQRRAILNALARHVRHMHASGLFSPDLFTRHIFVDTSALSPAFCLIDMARVDRSRAPSRRLRVRDLAALNVTAPVRHVDARERLRFLRDYADADAASLARPIARRMAHLLKRPKFATFYQ
ncbi:MAG: lipopolysaccharide kinase InaA family protein [Tepidisphaeraceae bacterium]